MFCHPAWAVGSCNSGPPAAKTLGTKSTVGFCRLNGSPCTKLGSWNWPVCQYVSLNLLAPSLRGVRGEEFAEGLGEDAVVELHKGGQFIKDVRKIFGILDPLPPCLHSVTDDLQY